MATKPPPVPSRETVLDADGRIKRVWSLWFEQLRKYVLDNANSGGGADDDSGLVPITRTVNGFPLSSDVVIPIPDIDTPVTVPNGGTGLFSTNTGDILYAPSSNTLAALTGNAATDTRVLTQSGDSTTPSAPAWSVIDIFKTISVSGQSDVVADTMTDTLTFTKSGGTVITTDASTDTIDIFSVNTIDGLTDAISNATSTVFLGTGSGASTSGVNNTAVGISSLNANSTGVDNSAVGFDSALNVITSQNTAIGSQSLKAASGADSVAVGYKALTANTGAQNTAVGSQALLANTSGTPSTAVGYKALAGNTTGNANVAVGDSALLSNVGKDNSVAIGSQAAKFSYDSASAGDLQITAVGYQALMGSATASNNTGTANTAIGNSALKAYTTSSNSTAVGVSALSQTTSGGNNTAVGYQALATNTTGANNTAVGYTAGGTAGDGKVCIGAQAGTASATGTVAIGYQASKSSTGGNSVSIGYQANSSATGTGADSVSVGYQALKVNTSGNQNTAIGYLSLTANVTGADNTGVGYKSLSAVSGSAGGNTALGANSAQALSSGTNNTIVGFTAGNTLDSGSTNIIIGYNVDVPTSGTSNYLNIGGAITGDMTTGPALMNGFTASTQSTTDNSTKVATTAYVTTAVSNAVAGVNPAVAVQAATTAAGDTSGFTYNNGAGGIGATFTGTINTAVTIDGYTFTTLGQRLLVKDDTQSPSGAFNGVYYVTQVQTAILAPILTRALDYDMPSDINNTGAIPVVNGTVNALTSWLLISSVTTVGTDPLTYVEFSRNINDILTFKTIAVSGQSDVVADSFADTLTLAAGTGITLTTNASTDTITITSTASGGLPTAAAGGTADAITADFTPDLTLTDKTICAVVAASANATATPTFSPDGLTAHTITKNGGSPLVAGDISGSGDVILLEYNLANTRWELLNPTTAVIPAGTVTGAMMSGTGAVRTIVCNVSGGFSVLPTGAVAMPITVPFTGTIAKWYMAADQSGSCVIDVKRSGTSIVGAGNKPTLSTAASGNAAPSSWTSTAITKGDILTFNVDSVTTCLSVNLVLEVTIT